MPISSFNTTNLGTCIRFLGLLGLGILIIVYVQFQARSFIKGPTISLATADQILHHDRSATLSGNAQNIVKLTLNDREIHTSESGDFNQQLILEEGYTIVEITAHDRFGRTTTLTREYVYVPSGDHVASGGNDEV